MRSDRKHVSVFRVALVVTMSLGLAVGGVAQAALAAIANGSPLTFTVGGASYTNSSYVQNNTSPGTVGVRVGRTDGTATAAGRLGANANMKTSSGTICAAAGTAYNGGSQVTFIRIATKSSCGTVSVQQAAGQTFVYDGGGYYSIYALNSPFLTL